MTRFTLDFDLSDSDQIETALRQLYTALADQHGEWKAICFLMREGRDLNAERAANTKKRRALTQAAMEMSARDYDLVLQYYAMECPSKRGLANGNEAIKKRLQRIFRRHPDACRAIGEAPPEMRAVWRGQKKPG
jgi:hypothetical protein